LNFFHVDNFSLYCYYFSMVKKGIGKIVRAQRKRLGLTAEKLAKEVGIDRTYISKIENYNLLPSAEVIDKISKALHTNLVEFYVSKKLPEWNLINPSYPSVSPGTLQKVASGSKRLSAADLVREIYDCIEGEKLKKIKR
jgi:DNA-binding XRE family transcriptional regulator